MLTKRINHPINDQKLNESFFSGGFSCSVFCVVGACCGVGFSSQDSSNIFSSTFGNEKSNSLHVFSKISCALSFGKFQEHVYTLFLVAYFSKLTATIRATNENIHLFTCEYINPFTSYFQILYHFFSSLHILMSQFYSFLYHRSTYPSL